MRRSLALGSSLTATLLFAVPTHAASLQTYVLAVSGQSSYPTYRAPDPAYNFFGPTGASLPSNGLPVGGLPGTERLQTAASGSLSDSAAASGSGTSSFGPWDATGSSSANTTFGRIGASGAGTRNGIGDTNTVVGFEGFGLFEETYTINSPTIASGSAGFVVFRMTVEGSLSRTGTAGGAGVAVNYRQNAGPIFGMVNAYVQNSGNYFNPSNGPGFDGFSFTPTSISGSGDFDTTALPLTYGTAFDLTFGLLAWSVPRGGTAAAEFSSTALLTGIDLYDAQGRRVTEFSIVSGSGTLYGADGVQFAAVPAPASLALLATAILAVPCVRRLGLRRSAQAA